MFPLDKLDVVLKGDGSLSFADKASFLRSNGSVMISAVDEKGNWQAEKLGFGDIWYFPKGVAHAVQGLEDDNEFLLV